MTATLPSTSGGSNLGGIYNVITYGATGNGSTDDTTAVQAAITAAINGGTVYFPPGTYKISSPLNVHSGHGLRLTGAGGVGQINTTPATLQFTPASGNLMECYSIAGFELDHLRFTYTNAAYAGDLINIDGGPLASDATNWTIHDCSSKQTSSITARSIIRLNRAINGEIRDCSWAGGINNLRIGDPGGSYVVGLGVRGCRWNNSTDAHILLASGDAEQIAIVDNNSFEAGTNTTAIRGATVAADGGQHLVYGMEISGNWFGDASTATTWVKNIHPAGQGTVLVAANRFATPDVTGIHLSGDGTWMIIGNHFEAGNVFSYSSQGAGEVVVMVGNYFGAITAKVANTDSALQFTEIGNAHSTNTPTTANTAIDGIGHGRLAIRGSSGAAMTDGDATEKLIVGAATNAGFGPAGVNKSFIFDGVTPNPTGERGLIIQGPWDGAHSHVLLAAGSGPWPLIELAGLGSQATSKLGFYAATPVVQASRAGQLTDSTGGSVSSTLAAGIADTVAKNAIASLAAKVNALETIIHNLGLSA